MLKNRFVLCCILLIIFFFPFVNKAYAGKKLKVVGTLEFLADWAQQIGQDQIEVDSVHDSRLDVHYFQPRPAHVLLCTRADMVIIAGLDLDIWMQSLLDASRNPKIQYGGAGYVDASFGISHILQKPMGRVDMAMGDVHPFGNPHYFNNMENVGIALENIVIGLSRNDPENTETYRKNKEGYWQRVQTTFKTLKELMKPFSGTKVVAYHQSWEYFAEEFGLEILGYVEPKPGLPASPKHTKELIDIMNQHEVKIILKEPYYPKGPVKKLMKQTGAKMVELVNYPGGRPKARTYLQNLEANIHDLVQAIGD
ncbi:MAG: metal ABC transporter substrate-binding protein [Candidatus Scalindua sp.]|nr:metal ABC transporter substrate-binding protein [Candidatus Scalindua sp.]